MAILEWPIAFLARDQTGLLGNQNQLQGAVGTQFLFDRGLMIGCGLGAHPQPLADFFHTVTLAQQAKDLEFAGGQGRGKLLRP